jgi:hypothetical protein
MPEIQPFRQLIDNITPIPSTRQRNQILRWVLHHRQQALLPRLFTDAVDRVNFAWEADGPNWIRTERLFVTVLGKTNEPTELPEKLAVALEKWKPKPHRLLMSRMRAELDEKGVLAEAMVIGNPYLQTGWLEEFLTEEASARTWRIRNSVTRHWESLGDRIHEKVMKFSERLAEHLLSGGKAKALELHSPQGLGEKRPQIMLHMNRYVCSKPVEGNHLTTGHILCYISETQKSYWLCLSPACDLVPGQQTSGWPGRLKDFLAFMAVELFPAKSDVALANAFGGNHLFLKVDDDQNEDPQCFSFTPLSPAGADGSKTMTPNPKWEMMFAGNQGLFDKLKQIDVFRISSKPNGIFSAISRKTQIVAQLRYEYALNLLQRLGSNLSRVGLDFIQPS